MNSNHATSFDTNPADSNLRQQKFNSPPKVLAQSHQPFNTRKTCVLKKHGPGQKLLKSDFVTHVTMETRNYYPPNTKMLKIWRMCNTGPTSWGQDVRLVYYKGDRHLFACESYFVPEAYPGQEVDIRATLRTPKKSGRVTTYFRLCKQGRFFGPRIWCDIIVAEEGGELEEEASE